jgi:hypothetical protein
MFMAMKPLAAFALREKRDVFFNNAARFLQLTPSRVARMQKEVRP